MFEDEHHGPALPESTPEMGLRFYWFGLGLAAMACLGGNAPWAAGVLAVLGLLGFALLIANSSIHAGTMRSLALRLSGWLLPVWVALAALAVGLKNPSYHLVTQNGQSVWELLPPSSAFLPGQGPLTISGFRTLVTVGLYSATLSAMLLCKNRLVFARTWAMLVFCAAAFAGLGLVQFGTHAAQILWIVPLDNPHFFSTFPHSAQWCAFALLWMGAALGVLGWLVRQRGWRWLNGEGWGLLVSAALLGLSIVMVGDPLHVILALLVGSVGCLIIAWQTRADRMRTKHGGLSFGVVAWALLGLGLFGLAAASTVRHPLDTWINYAGGGAAMHDRVLEDTQTMWRQRPWFGWGAGSFGVVYSFFQGTDQSPLYFAFARSDFWQSLAEHGIIGTVAWCVPVLWVLARLAGQRRLAIFLCAPLAGLAAVVALAFVDFPFACPAVCFAFWLILFSLGRWSEVDKEDRPSALSERRHFEKLRAEGKTLPPKPAPARP